MAEALRWSQKTQDLQGCSGRIGAGGGQGLRVRVLHTWGFSGKWNLADSTLEGYAHWRATQFLRGLAATPSPQSQSLYSWSPYFWTMGHSNGQARSLKPRGDSHSEPEARPPYCPLYPGEGTRRPPGMCSQIYMGDIQDMPLLRLAASRRTGLGSFSPLGRDHIPASGAGNTGRVGTLVRGPDLGQPQLAPLSPREIVQSQGLQAVVTTLPAPEEGKEGPGQARDQHKTHLCIPRATLAPVITLAAGPPCSPNLDPGPGCLAPDPNDRLCFKICKIHDSIKTQGQNQTVGRKGRQAPWGG